jgi:ribose 5-phosphate isomerase B
VKTQTIYLATDHAGFKLKEKLKAHLSKKYKIKDFSPKFKPKDDYPNEITPAARKVSKDKSSLAIILGGSGQGEAIAANRIKGVRAIVIYSYNPKIIKLSKEHNDANILSLGSRFLTTSQAIKAVDLWLKTKFSNQKRHKRRIKKLK